MSITCNSITICLHLHHSIKSIHKTRHARNPSIIPIAAVRERPHEHQIHTENIASVFGHKFIRAHHVSFGFAHLRTVLRHHALMHQTLEWFLGFHMTQIVHHLVDETRVQKMHARVLRPSNVHVHGHPFIRSFFSPRLLSISGIGITQKVPTAAHKSIHGIHFSFSRPATIWTLGVHKFFHRRQRRGSLRHIVFHMRMHHR